MRIRILTQNLYNGRAKPAAFAAALLAHEPDVVAVQELAPNAAPVLADWAETTLLDPREDTTGMGVAVRGPAVLDRLEFPFRRPVSVLLQRDSWGLATDLQVINTHLVNPISRPILESRDLRREELAALRYLVTADAAAPSQVLVGDFNSSPMWPLYRRLQGILTDGAVAAGTARRTWGPWPSWPRLLRIDHALTRGRVRVVATDTVTVAGSDHSGLLVDIEIG